MNYSISLLISTYNWEQALILCLRSISRQTVMPNEILIADDGSGKDTAVLIEKFRREINVPIIHVWQEDKGFRKTLILNKAIALAHGDYIIEIDGDVIANRHFIQDHIEMMRPGYYICGSRAKLPLTLTHQLLKEKRIDVSLSEVKTNFIYNSIRSKILRHLLAKFYGTDIMHMRSCNFAFWKKDIIAVNGYNEDIQGWGLEDTELAYRLHYSGVKKKFLKMGGIIYHLEHKKAPRGNVNKNFSIRIKTISECHDRCSNGIDKYLRKSYKDTFYHHSKGA
jgi:glycosyltransferase involved in cell wall biosynthesis